MWTSLIWNKEETGATYMICIAIVYDEPQFEHIWMVNTLIAKQYMN